MQCKCVKRWYNWVYKAHVLKSTILRSHLGNLVRPRGKFKPIQALFVCPPFGTSGSCSYYSWVWPVQRTTNEDLDSQSRVLRECGGDIIFKLHHGVYANTQTLCDNECLFFLCVCVCLCRSGTWFDDFVECHYQLHVSVRRPVPSTTNISESSTWNIDPCGLLFNLPVRTPWHHEMHTPSLKARYESFRALDNMLRAKVPENGNVHLNLLVPYDGSLWSNLSWLFCLLPFRKNGLPGQGLTSLAAKPIFVAQSLTQTQAIESRSLRKHCKWFESKN